MITQIVFKADKSLKDKAMKKAQSEGVTLKAVLYNALKLYIEGKIKFGLQINEPEIEILEVTPKIQKKMDKIGTLLEKI
ncbi:MAG: hypothetical protein GWP15_02625 [Nitrospirae bacterium]|nr:hypothetical protein [Nitrospirota bacterium]